MRGFNNKFTTIKGNEINTSDDAEEAKIVVRVFKRVREKNSRSWLGDYRYIEYLNPSNDEERDDKHFAVFRDALVCFLESNQSDEELSEKSSFVLLEDNSGDKNERLRLEKYLEIIKDSKSAFEYMIKLWRIGQREKCRVMFSLKEIDSFCSNYFYINFKYNSYLIDIKEIEPKKYWHSHKNEKERFWEIDKLWGEYKDRDAARKSREFLTYYLESARGKTFSKNKNIKSKEIESILCDLVSHFKIEGLCEDLNIILHKFREIRNKLKAEAPERKEAKEFENSPHKSINTRLLIDLLKALHNALIVMEKMSKENLNK